MANQGLIKAGGFLILSMFIFSCGEIAFPRPRGFPRVELPASHEYKTYSRDACPFSFEYPANGLPERELADSCVLDIRFPGHNYKWHITYRRIGDGKPRRVHEEEYRELVMKHISHLDKLVEEPLQTPQGWGILFEMIGTLGAPAQVIFGDSSHLLMASFYFDRAVSQDSLKPLVDWVKEDLRHMVQTVKFLE